MRPCWIWRGVVGVELFRGSALGSFVHRIAEVAQVENAGGWRTREEGFELNRNLSSVEHGLDEFQTLSVSLGEITKGYGVAVANPPCYLLGSAYGHRESPGPTFCIGLKISSQGTARQNLRRFCVFLPFWVHSTLNVGNLCSPDIH